MRLKFIFSLLFLTFFSLTYSQISFTNNTSLLENESLAGGFVMGISDLNGDNLEDIIRFQNAQIAEIEYQNTDGSFSTFNVGSLIGGEVWSVAVADIDGNGLNDFITGGFYESLVKVSTNGTSNVDMELLDGPLIFLQGSCFSDIDNDGNIDLFACHDDGLSPAFRGSATGDLNFDASLVNTTSTVPSNNAGNYAATWTDYDNDGDNDLYISKCRLGVVDPMSGDRLNLMFRKEADGSFTEVAPFIGLQPQGQSWSAEFGDIDNDGDMDVIILNHDIDSKLYENDGTGNFTDISASAGINLTVANFSAAMQTYMQDYDNDGYLDIFVTSYATYPFMYHNNGDNTFTQVAMPWGDDVNTNQNTNIQSAAMGDLNNDGFVDMIAGFANGINLPNPSSPDRLYLNETNGNNWIGMQLVGTDSNINGIGARIEINGPWGTQIREVRSGGSYGIMNSLKTNVGIGSATEITSIVVKWPSGIVTTTTNPQINTYITIPETIQSSVNQTVVICEGENYMGYTEPGVYTDEITMDSVVITTLIVNNTYNIQAMPVNACHGVTIIYGEETIDAPGSYVFNYTTAEGCDSTVSVDVNWYDEIEITETIVDDNGTGTGSISIDISGAVDPINISWSNEDVDVTEITGLDAGDYSVDVIDGNVCVMSESYTVGTSGLDELIALGINVYPNPFNDRILIKDPENQIYKLELYNHLGQNVIQQSLTNSAKTIDTKNLMSGIYILKLMDVENNVIGTVQLVK